MASRATSAVPRQTAWGLGPHGELVHIRHAERGRSGLVCPGCRSPLVARQGRLQAWHFAHVAGDTLGDCAGETVLHHAAKRLVVQAAEAGLSIHAPTILEHATGRDLLGRPMAVGRGADGGLQAMLGGMNEHALGGGLLIADVIVERAGSGTLAVEICVTHRKSVADEALYAALGQPVLEIDLSGYRDDWELDRDELLAIVLEKAPRRWVWSPTIARCRAEAEAILAEEIARRNDALLVEAERFLPTDETLLSLPPITFVVKAAAGDLVAAAEAARALSSIDGAWERVERGWRRPATADDGTPVECRFGFAGIGDAPADMPALVMQFGRSGVSCEGWRHTEPAWPLTPRAQAALAALQARQAMARQIREGMPVDDGGRLAYLCRALGLQPPLDREQASASPGVSRATWRTAAWVYLVIHREVAISRPALGAWCGQLLRPGAGARNRVRERQELTAWLAELTTLALLQEEEGGSYRVTLPEGFEAVRPWLPLLGMAPTQRPDESQRRPPAAESCRMSPRLALAPEAIVIPGPDADGERRPLTDLPTTETTLCWEPFEEGGGR